MTKAGLFARFSETIGGKLRRIRRRIGKRYCEKSSLQVS